MLSSKLPSVYRIMYIHTLHTRVYTGTGKVLLRVVQFPSHDIRIYMETYFKY